MSDKGEFAELLWENGQAVLHGRKPHIPVAPFPPFACSNVGSSRAQEKHGGGGGGGGGGEFAMLPKTSAFGSLEMAAVQDDGDDDAVPWIHYPVVDDVEDTAPLPADYCSELLSELLPPMTSANLGSLASSSHHTTTNRSAHIPSKESQSAHVQTAPPPVPVSKQPRPSGGGGTVMNFSLFSRPAALARATLQRPPQGDDKAPAPASAPTATSSNPVESTVVQTTSRLRSTPLFTDQRMAWFQRPKDQRLAPAAAPPAPAAPTHQQETAGNGDTPNPRTSQRPQPEERAHEAPVTSSVCSGNGAVDDDRLRQLKLRTRAECSASQDEDMDDDPGEPRRTSATRSTKRSRTAEVHNLSERRRRDRINEKMRALQELIPNCNKIDKASMLDEAIEYLKTLQLQVQMMSLGGGLCMPPMLLPPHLQHLQLPPMAHFPHLGMGLGYGMGGAFDLATAGGGAPMFPLTPPIPGAQFPCPMVPAPPLGMPGSAAMPMFAAAQLVGMPYRDAHLFPQASAAMAHMVQEQMHSLAPNQQQLQQQQEANSGDSHIATIPHGDQK